MSYTPTQLNSLADNHGEDEDETGAATYNLGVLESPFKLTHINCRGNLAYQASPGTSYASYVPSQTSLGIYWQPGGSGSMPTVNGDNYQDFNWLISPANLWSVTDNVYAVTPNYTAANQYVYTSAHGFTLEGWRQLAFRGTESVQFVLAIIPYTTINGYKIFHSTWIDYAIGGPAQP
jgi:hypothetical protein